MNGKTCKRGHPVIAGNIRRRVRWGREYEECLICSLAHKRATYHRHKDNAPQRERRGTRDPVKDAAKRLAYRALRRGEIQRPGGCQECGEATARLHAHHPDYSRPLSVEFLCVKCHGARHRRVIALAGGGE